MKYSIKKLIRNLKFLMKYDLQEIEKENLIKQYNMIEDICMQEILDLDKNSLKHSLDILNYQDTVDLLIKEPKSFCRFGDGEIELMLGNSIPFQKYDEKLKKILLEILESNNDNLYVGISYHYFHVVRNLNIKAKNFYILNGKKYKEFLLEHCYKNRCYIASEFTLTYISFDKFDYEKHFEKLKKLFTERELAIFAGEGILNKLNYNIFETAKSIEFIDCPKINAFDEFQKILERALGVPPRKNLGVYIRTDIESIGLLSI